MTRVVLTMMRGPLEDRYIHFISIDHPSLVHRICSHYHRRWGLLTEYMSRLHEDYPFLLAEEIYIGDI